MVSTRLLNPRNLIPAVIIIATLAGCGGGGGEGGGVDGAATDAALVFRDSFDACNISPTWGQPLHSDESLYSPRTRQPLFVDSPAHSSPCAANYYASADTNERTPWQIGMDDAKLVELFGGLPEEIYMEWWEFFEPGYPFASSSQKLVRWGYANPDHEESRKTVTVLIQTRNADLNLQYFCGSGDQSRCQVDDSLHSDQPIPLGRWVKLGLWIKLNSPGDSDGFLRLYRDDALLIEGVDLDLRGDDDRGFDFFWLGGNYSMTSGVLSGSGNRYIDDFALYTSYPR